MKKLLTLLLCITLLLACFVLFGCNQNEPLPSAPEPEVSLAPDTEPPKPAVLELASGGETHYKIIRPDGGGEQLAEMSKELCIYLSELSGARIRVSSDLVGHGVDPDGVSEYEILLAGTNRTSDDGSLDGAGNDGWCVTAVGTRIIINAQSACSLTEAIEYFKSVTKTEDGKMTFDISSAKTEFKEYPLMGTTLRVGSYNIKHGSDVGLDFSIIAADIKALDLDIVGFQEIDLCTSRVNGLDTPALIAKRLGYEYYYFTRAINYKGGEYGTLIVSRYPIETAESYEFPKHSGYEDRAMGHAVINVNGARVDFFNTHLSYEEKSLQLEQFGILGEKLSGVRGFILTGDFNTSDTSLYSPIKGHKLVNPKKYVTFPTSGYIDNIVLESGWEIVASGVGPKGHSDHIMLWAEIKYNSLNN